MTSERIKRYRRRRDISVLRDSVSFAMFMLVFCGGVTIWLGARSLDGGKGWLFVAYGAFLCGVAVALWFGREWSRWTAVGLLVPGILRTASGIFEAGRAAMEGDLGAIDNDEDAPSRDL